MLTFFTVFHQLSALTTLQGAPLQICKFFFDFLVVGCR